MKSITGIHVVSDGPRTEPRKTWELLMQLASLKLYQQNFGPMNLMCCEEAHDYFNEMNILKYYDNVEILDTSLTKGIDHKKYFAASKLLAQLQCDLEECIFIDTDLLINNQATHEWLETEVCGFLHTETSDVYDEYDGLAINCAFNLWKDKELRRKYASTALKLIYDGNISMIDVEQATLGSFLITHNINPSYVINNVWDTENNRFIRFEGDKFPQIMDTLLHAWGGKINLHALPLEAADFTIKLIELLEEFEDVDLDDILEKFAL